MRKFKKYSLMALFSILSSISIAQTPADNIISMKKVTDAPSVYPNGAYMMSSESDSPYSWPFDAGVIFGFKPGQTNYRHPQFIVGHNPSYIRVRMKDANNDNWSSWRDLMVSDGNGKFGIGTASPNFKLHINASDNQLVRLSSSQLGTWMDFENTQAASGSKIWSIGHAGPNGQFGISQRDGIDEYRMVIDGSGNIGIGTTTPSEKLEVNGTIRTQEVKVESTPWPDYVFSDTYQLNPLSEVSSYIQENHHLPGIPTAEEVAENGIKLGEMNAKLLEKVEELTLYLIEMKAENEEMKDNYSSEIDRLKNENNEFKTRLEKLEKVSEP